MRIKHTILLMTILVAGAMRSIGAMAQATATDSISLEKPSQGGSAPFLDAEVQYKAKDSLAFDFETKKMYLFGDAEVTYGDIHLTAYAIELDMDSTLAYAYGKKDSLGVESGLPVFSDKSGEYEMRELRYNFETKKAIITHLVTEQGEGYVIGHRAKRVDEKTYFMKNAQYTTCSNHDHPHFYLNLTKAKVIPGKKTITGPAYLVIEDVPLPLAIPFAIIPNTKHYSSGIIMPTYGDESTRGFYLRNGGYYMAVNDYFDVKLLADIYTKGSWGTHITTTYKKKYKFSGSFAADYIVNKTSEEDLPDYSETKDFSVKWNHSQDTKANPDITFSASVNFSTSSYNKNSITNVVNPAVLATNQKSSSISYSRKWPWNPFRLTASLLHSQNSRDTSISLTLPDVSVTTSKRFYPFKPAKMVGAGNPITNLNISYSMSMKNSISCKEKDLTFAPEDFATAWKNGMKHTIPITTTIKLFKYFTFTPTASYTERWYLNKTRQYWDEENQKIVKCEPERGFNRTYDYNFSVGTSTKVYVFYKPIRLLFGDKINAIRHLITPSVSYTYTPDFSQRKYGFYDSFEYYKKSTDEIVNYKYSYYNGYLYGTPGSARSGRLSLSMSNTIEMKVKSDQDSTGFKKISLIEGLSLSSGYDFMKDSLRWDNISLSGRTKVFGTNVSYNATFDQYGYVASKTGSAIRIDRSALRQNHRLAHLKSAGISFGFQLSPEVLKKLARGETKIEDEKGEGEDDDWALNAGDDGIEEGAQMPHNDQTQDTRLDKGDSGYAEFSMPWSLSFNYSLRVSQNKFNPKTCLYSHKVTQSLNVSGNISPTPKWKFSITTGYSFDEHKLSQTSIGITRDLHCWNMNFNMVPVGAYKSYSFSIAISSSLLQDLKYQQSSSPRDNGYY
ncbi:MAG: LPS-assembly protein LptD [Bacteroidales bacterium]|nr:LPS-assembly protein LptD [Bacteroidales bacterium]